MNLRNYHKFRKIIKLIEWKDCKVINLKNYNEFESFLYKQISKFVKKLNFDKIYRQYKEIDYPEVYIKYYLLDLYKNKVVKKKDYFFVDINYEIGGIYNDFLDEYEDEEIVNLDWKIDGEPYVLTGDILLAMEMKCKINNYKNKCCFVFKNELIVNKNDIDIGYIINENLY